MSATNARLELKSWRSTALWAALKGKESVDADAADVAARIQVMMPKIEAILAAGDTAPADFTLHDEWHAFRVAERMAEVIPEGVLPALSAYELALLLLSAYLHDIGMSPKGGLLDRHWRYLVFGAGDDRSAPRLSEREAADLQQWLDDDGRGIEAPLCSKAATEEELRLATELMTHYCRHKHNDWSEVWIRQELGDASLSLYDGWLDDLVTVCRSHHEGYDDLRESRFDPHPARATGAVVHLRYLACALRIADVLDVDPERTPDVVLAHRNVTSPSLLYWRKDHVTWIRRDGSVLTLTARPDSAVLEKAIRTTAADIESELHLCERIARERRFDHCTFQATAPLPHRWDYPSSLVVDIQPKPGTYVYIDGAFRPNTAKLLQILSGTQLYGDSDVPPNHVPTVMRA